MTELPDDNASAYMRRIRSFVLREGRMTPAQQRAFDTLWSRYGIDYHGTAHDFGASFGRQARRRWSAVAARAGDAYGKQLRWERNNL